MLSVQKALSQMLYEKCQCKITMKYGKSKNLYFDGIERILIIRITIFKQLCKIN